MEYKFTLDDKIGLTAMGVGGVAISVYGMSKAYVDINKHIDTDTLKGKIAWGSAAAGAFIAGLGAIAGSTAVLVVAITSWNQK